MLGILAVVSLVLGAFVAGGAAFNWEFLFSDGYREHDWVRSFGHDGARGLLILLGIVLVIGGFVGEIVDTASKPVIVSAENSKEGTIDNPDDPSQRASTSSDGGAVGFTSPKVAGSSTGADSAPPASYRPAAANSSTGAGQAGPQFITIWEPQAADEEGSTLVTLQYRFEPGQQRQTRGRYFWIIESLVSTLEVEYDAELLQKQGQLTHLLRAPLAASGLLQPWSTALIYEANGRRKQVSNQLRILPGSPIRSTPPPAQ